MQYGCIGEHLPHSFSKIIHERIGSYEYELKEIAPDVLDGFMTARDFRAINVTIPYKQSVIPYLSEISESARKIGAVNTVVNHGGKLYGYNTDYIGLKTLALKENIQFGDKKVLILGTGGTAKTAFALCRDMGARQVLKVSRTEKEDAVTYTQVYGLHTDADIIINTTPCGMFPEIFGIPIDITEFKNLCGVLDAVYNPLNTELIIAAKKQGIPARGGLYMLVSQAVAAAEIFTGAQLSPDTADVIFSNLLKEKQNVVLIGMPSCGKTTVGEMLSKSLGRPFIDTDKEIEKLTGRSPSEIIRENGTDYFRNIETEVVKSIACESGAVISTGGGTVLRTENVDNLRKNGRLFWLDRDCELLVTTSDRPLSDSPEKLRALYEERRVFYSAAADTVIKANATAQECARSIEEVMWK